METVYSVVSLLLIHQGLMDKGTNEGLGPGVHVAEIQEETVTYIL